MKPMQMPIREKPTAEAATIVRKLNPTARMPAPSLARGFSAADRELLERRLQEPVECVYNPTFRRSTMPEQAVPVTVSAPETPTLLDPDVGAVTPRVTEVLTAEQERAMFLRFNYCRHRVMILLRHFRGRRLTGSGARQLLHWDRFAQRIRADIVRANTSLVLAMARRSRNNGVELGELVSEGNLALLRCVDKFDASRGFKFSTYACRAILASFSRAGAKAARHRAQFPTPYDPAMERSDHLEARRERIEHECVDELKRILFDNSADLSAVERRVLTARFSLDQPETKPSLRRKTLDQVGDLLGVSKERVRQIQNQAMIKLRAVLEERLLAAS